MFALPPPTEPLAVVLPKEEHFHVVVVATAGEERDGAEDHSGNRQDLLELQRAERARAKVEQRHLRRQEKKKRKHTAAEAADGDHQNVVQFGSREEAAGKADGKVDHAWSTLRPAGIEGSEPKESIRVVNGGNGGSCGDEDKKRPLMKAGGEVEGRPIMEAGGAGDGRPFIEVGDRPGPSRRSDGSIPVFLKGCVSVEAFLAARSGGTAPCWVLQV